MTPMPRWARLFAAGAATLLAAPWLVLAGIDAGLFDKAIEGLASARAGRPVTFARLHAHLLSSHPSIAIEGLTIASPPAITREPLLEAPLVTARLRPAPLLAFRLQPDAIAIIRPRLHLVRVRSGVSNYAFGSGDGAGLLGAVKALTITGGVVDYTDLERQTTLAGQVSQAAGEGGVAGFRLSGGGVIKGGAYVVTAHGAPLNGRPAGAPYPFTAVLQDGATRVVISGTSGRPFYFHALDLAVRASGPNFADLGYLFGAATPNTAPFDLTARVRRDGPRLQMLNIVARAGRSDLTGEVTSERRPDRPTLLQARLAAGVLSVADVRAVVAARPPHAVTRIASGAIRSPSRGGGGGLPDTPFPNRAPGKLDLQIDLTAARVVGAPVPIGNLSAHIAWVARRLAVTPARFDTLQGRAGVAARLDLARPTPSFAIAGDLRGARLGALPEAGGGVDGDLDVFFDLSGEGLSPRAMAAATRGRLAFRVGPGALRSAEAAALSGDLVQAVLRSAVGGKAQRTALDCAVGEFAAEGGRLRATRLDIVTADGWTAGSGGIDLPDERVAITLRGAPAPGRGVHIGAPLAVTGSLEHPAVSLDPDAGRGGGPRRGLGGALATVGRSVASVISPPPPPTPAPDCSKLLPEVGRYVGE